jgi:hypothetical protein
MPFHRMTPHPRLTPLLLLLALPAFAAPPPDANLQPIGLPYSLNDNFGSNWDVQFDGSIGDGGNDLYDGGGRLFIDGQFQFTSNTGQAALDNARQEIVFPVNNINGLNVSRRVASMTRLGAVRFTEILENPTAQPRRVLLRVYFNLGGFVASASPLVRQRGGNGDAIGGAKNANAPVGYAIQDRMNALAMVGAGAGAKVIPRFNFQQQSDNVDLFYDVEIPARQTAVIVHFQIRRSLAAEAAAVWQAMRDKDLLADVPKDLLKKVVNFRTGDGFVDDLEILRGDALDALELRGGDSYRGSLVANEWRLHTLYGTITLPAHKVIALLNVGKYRANQLLITTDGEVIAGRLDCDTIDLRLSGGQITRIPLAQITRLGYRRRPGEIDPADWSFENKPTAFLRGGERLQVNLLNPSFDLATPIGPLCLPAQFISSIAFQAEQSNVPMVTLRDGSHISALLPATTYEAALPGLIQVPNPIYLTPGSEPPALSLPNGKTTTRIPLSSTNGTPRVRLPAAALLRLTFSPEPDVEPLAPRVLLSNQDELVGSLIGTLTLHAPFDTIKIEGPQVRRLAPASNHTGAATSDVQITLWDDSTLSGRLAEPHLTVQLRCGVIVKPPVALVREYVQPLPQPSDPMARRIRTVAKELDADDWATRDRAHTHLLSIGPPAMAVLKEVRAAATPEGRQRIDLLLQSLSAQLKAPGEDLPNNIDANGDGVPDNAIINGPLFDR